MFYPRRFPVYLAVSAICLIGCDASKHPETTAPDAEPLSPDARSCATVTEDVIDVGELSLHVVEQGCGKTAVLLHGFPEIGYAWTGVRESLANQFHVVVPDQRGYNVSDIPKDVEDYRIDHLVADIKGLIEAASAGSVVLVAHDWGGAVAWVVANRHPELISHLVIIDAPHPDVFARELLENPQQKSASQYMNFFISPTAESVLTPNNYQALIDAFDGLLTEEEDSRYREAYAEPGALTGMLNWYRANILSGPTPASHWPTNVVIDVPTLVMWGMQDTALLPGNLNGLGDYVKDLQVREFPDASHWVVHQEPAAVIQAIRDFVDET